MTEFKKSVNICQSYEWILNGMFFMAHSVLSVSSISSSAVAERPRDALCLSFNSDYTVVAKVDLEHSLLLLLLRLQIYHCEQLNTAPLSSA